MRVLFGAGLLLCAVIPRIAALERSYLEAGGGKTRAIPGLIGGGSFNPEAGGLLAAGLLIASLGVFLVFMGMGVFTSKLPGPGMPAAAIVGGVVVITRGIGGYREIGLFNRRDGGQFAEAAQFSLPATLPLSRSNRMFRRPQPNS